ncbi:hypothetical protein KUTeg_011945 [Tegillarca granosa]|uniref:C2H2-type domain-containing protein n=1 Tax=Tegillarca granosa TaxID=220873 RepID=A0ABQ9F3A8_TEGGR|nr:hypothetical protein KUTeg_011945 [Tegillarca granosa]
MWSKIRTEDGQEGYVPSSYIMVLEEELTSLPWLKQPVETEQQAAEWKPYKSAYSKENPEEKVKAKYFCDVCQKDFNGPQPYSAHMNSKAHKEEVALLED